MDSLSAVGTYQVPLGHIHAIQGLPNFSPTVLSADNWAMVFLILSADNIVLFAKFGFYLTYLIVCRQLGYGVSNSNNVRGQYRFIF